jgi:hypothetical protein
MARYAIAYARYVLATLTSVAFVCRMGVSPLN